MFQTISTLLNDVENIVLKDFTISKNTIIFLDIKERKTNFTSIIVTDSEVKFAMADKFIITIYADNEFKVMSNGIVIELDTVEKEIVYNSILLCINLIKKSIQEYRMLNEKQAKEEFFKLLLLPNAIQEVLDELY